MTIRLALLTLTLTSLAGAAETPAGSRLYQLRTYPTAPGKRDVLVGKLLEHSGSTKEQVEKEIAEFESTCKAAAPPAECA